MNLPKRQQAQKIFLPLAQPVQDLNLEDLTSAHQTGLRYFRQGQIPFDCGYSWLEVKTELAKRWLKTCNYCVHNCQVNRPAQELGYCQLNEQSIISGEYIHHGEEAEISPTHAIFFSGCTMHCLYCHNWRETFDLQAGARVDTSDLIQAILKRSQTETVKTLSLLGGTPEPHLHTICALAAQLPSYLTQPLVLNGNATLSQQGLELMEGLIDIYVPDFKHGNDRCAWQIAKISNYLAGLRQNLRAYLSQKAQVLVRHLVLPNHLECCTYPILQDLSENFPQVQLNLMYQYRPMYRARENPTLARKVSEAEKEQVELWVKHFNLQPISH